MSSLVQSEKDLSDLINKFQEYTEFDDLRYFAMKSVLELLKCHLDVSNVSYDIISHCFFLNLLLVLCLQPHPRC